MQRKCSYLRNTLELLAVSRIADLIEEWSILAIIGGGVVRIAVVETVEGMTHRWSSVIE